LSTMSSMEATKQLTKFFVKARFGIDGDDFYRRFVDGKDDGGIDFYNIEDGTYYIIQTKFSSSSQKASLELILHELDKISNTIIGQNPNQRAAEFVNDLRRQLNKTCLLEIIWLTTDVIEQSTVLEAQKRLDELRKSHNWSIELDFVPFDSRSLDRMIFDVEHGYIPYTARKRIEILDRKYLVNSGYKTGLYSIVCSVRLVDMLKWLQSSEDVKRYLQKNVREYKGDNQINRAIKKSYLETPEWFWHKHNGIIIFADSISVEPDDRYLVMRNPQIVNGGQTLRTLFAAYDQQGRKDSDAQVLLRAYRLPYESSETYKKSIEIIKALNTQNAVKPSDLHSTDARQVRIQKLLESMDYKYHRKSGKEFKAARYAITMRNLALYYHICKNRAPHDGVRGQVEEIFEETSKYDDVFPEERINRDLSSRDHVVLDYVVTWTLADLVSKVSKSLPRRYRDLSWYTKYFVLLDVYSKLDSWKKNFGLPGWRNWKEFVESNELENELWGYIDKAFRIATDMIPKDGLANPRKFLTRKEAAKRFEAKTQSQHALNLVANRAFKKWSSTTR
jgi:hypothetical protein